MKKANFFATSKKNIQGPTPKKEFLFTKPPLIKLFYSSLVLNLISILSVIILRNNLPPEVPLFYGFAEGEEQLTSVLSLTLPGIFSLIIVGVNFFVATLSQNNFLRHTLIVSSFFVSTLSLVTTFKIIFLVGSF